MFDFLTDSIHNALNVADGLMEGELPTKMQLARLIADGVSIAAISEVTGMTVNAIEEILYESD